MFFTEILILRMWLIYKQAAVVNNPENPNELALFLYETYYPLNK